MEKLFPNYSQNRNWAYLWIINLKFYGLLWLYAKLRATEIFKLWQRPLAFTLYEASLETRRGLELAHLAHFCIIFEEKYFSCYIFWTDQISLSDFFYFARYWAICVSCDVKNFEINLIFLIKLFFLGDQKVKTKLQTSWERK